MLYGHKILVFCTSQIYKERFCEFISILNTQLVAQNWRIMIFSTESDLHSDTITKDGEKDVFKLINYDIADAVLLDNNAIQDKQLQDTIIENAYERNLPVFLLHGDRKGCFNIAFNQEKGFEQICQHVIERHRVTDLHFMAGTRESSESQLRLEVFKKVLANNDLPFDDSMVSYGGFWEGPTRIAILKLIKENRVPKAIICANDAMAITTTTVLKENNYYCPEDVIVTGYDGINSIHFSTPKITSSICDYKLLGSETARLILKIDENRHSPFSTLLQPTMFVSESCGCVARQPSNTLSYINRITDCYARYRSENTELNNLSVLIHECKNIEEVTNKLKNPALFYNLMFLVKSECIDSSVDPSICHSSSTYGSSMYLLADSDVNTEPANRFIKTKDLIPRMEEVLKNYEYPLIFAPVNTTLIPVGYLCYFFRNYDSQNYTKVAQIASWLGNALSGYRNTQYLRYLQTKLEDVYKYDSLTHLFNRNGFINTYNKLMEDDSVSTITMAMCDLDNLKHINDNFSHNEGDNAICVVGQALSSALLGGNYCRYGGDEIIGLYTSKVDPDFIKTKIKAYLDDYNANSGKPYKVSTSVGVYTSPKTSFEEVFAKADKLMYEEKLKKNNGRR